MEVSVPIPTFKSFSEGTQETIPLLKDTKSNSLEDNQSLALQQQPPSTLSLPQPSIQTTRASVVPVIREQVPHEIVINYDTSSKTYNFINRKNNQKWKSCLLDCKNRLPFDLILDVRKMFESLCDASKKKNYIKKCLVFKCNDKVKRRKKYKRDMSYNCIYYLIINECTHRVCQRCFRFILGLTRYNLSNIIKESLPNTR